MNRIASSVHQQIKIVPHSVTTNHGNNVTSIPSSSGVVPPGWNAPATVNNNSVGPNVGSGVSVPKSPTVSVKQSVISKVRSLFHQSICSLPRFMLYPVVIPYV